MTTEPVNIYPDDQAWLQASVASLTFGEAIRAHRQCEEWTVQGAADKLGVSKQLLSAYENRRKPPSPSKAYEIAKALGMEPRAAVLMVINDQLRMDNLPLQVRLVS